MFKSQKSSHISMKSCHTGSAMGHLGKNKHSEVDFTTNFTLKSFISGVSPEVKSKKSDQGSIIFNPSAKAVKQAKKCVNNFLRSSNSQVLKKIHRITKNGGINAYPKTQIERYRTRKYPEITILLIFFIESGKENLTSRKHKFQARFSSSSDSKFIGQSVKDRKLNTSGMNNRQKLTINSRTSSKNTSKNSIKNISRLKICQHCRLTTCKGHCTSIHTEKVYPSEFSTFSYIPKFIKPQKEP